MLVSPNGLQQAYATVKAQAFRNSEGYELCHNRSNLYVARDGKQDFRSVLTYQSKGKERGAQGNGIQLIDWSPDSRLLLLDLMTWYYESEGWEHNIVIYSVKTRTVKMQSLGSIFSRALKKPCNLDGRLNGFTPHGRIALTVGPVDEESEGPSCFSAQGEWEVDASTFTVVPVIRSEKIKRNGHFKSGK